ncbi:sigma-70 family RNA polymerase sigma factor [Streptomyces sp. NPDC008240]|uniref:RNA polymerase sigma factor n=1 Tax=Streptomyces sp. NPDC008240 TaxID=3364822 RepID=UPI0036EB72B3
MDEQQRAQRAQALAALVAERRGQMVARARAWLRNLGVPPSWADPEDVVHNALTSVLACPKPIEGLRPYVFKAIKNEAGHAARRYRGGQGYASLDADVQLETAAGAADACAAADLRLDLDAALTALPPQQRKSVWCNKALGLTQTETANVMGAAPGTVATHVSRAVKALRVTLGALLGVVLAAFTAAWVRTGTLPIEPAAAGDLAAQMENWLAHWGWPETLGAVVGGVSLAWLAYTLTPTSRYPWHWISQKMTSRLRGRRAAEPGAEESSVVWQGQDWTVRQVAGAEGKKMYRCPGCDQVIPAGVPHVVVRLTLPGVEDRRHWHKACWDARDRRRARAR